MSEEKHQSDEQPAFHEADTCPACGGSDELILLCHNSQKKYVCLNPASGTYKYPCEKPTDSTGECHMLIYKDQQGRFQLTGKRFNRDITERKRRNKRAWELRPGAKASGFVRPLVPVFHRSPLRTAQADLEVQRLLAAAQQHAAAARART